MDHDAHVQAYMDAVIEAWVQALIAWAGIPDIRGEVDRILAPLKTDIAHAYTAWES
ncbi:hypothetical protein [Nocardia abscessus]|uniref:hypothetical protein n=1 Tax=Nocardia abscessus TaxID=120957 RepID=UPI002454F852|nr:hypothetical protein [Nocardia abscessus]